ncbi:MAG: hypothetical protein CMJ59_11595 [Planctomycetaceae bacterium]|nr:hypothetical protein [Planctomycetaceae bacterium]
MEVVEYTSADAGDIVDLMNLALGRANEVRRDVDYWHWKHDQNPFGQSLVLLAKVAGQLVGMRSFMRWSLSVEGQVLSVAKPVDTVTHPDFRRQGIFRTLTESACERASAAGVVFLFNTPNQSSRPGYIRLGWQHVGDVSVRVRPRRPVSIAAGLLKNWLGGKRSAAGPCQDSTVPSVSQVLADRVQVKELLATLPPRRGAATVRGHALLQWRYGAHPHADYRAVELREGSRLAGLALFRMRFRRGLYEAMLDDVLVRDNREETAKKLIRKLLRTVQADYIVAHCCEEEAFGRLWRRRAWPAPRRTALPLLGRAIGPLPDAWNPFDLAHWNLCLGDLEGL